MAAPPRVDPLILPRRFPVGVGLGVAGAVGGGLLLLGKLGALPAPLWTAGGQMLIGAHALAAYALTCMVGDAVRLSGWSAELRRQESEDPEDVHSGPVGKGIDRVMDDLRRRYAISERQAAVATRADLLLREYSPRWWIGTAVAFLIPLFGGLAALWNLRVDTNAVPFRELGLPLLVSVVEAMPVLLISTSLRRSAETALERWKVAVEEVARVQRPSGRRIEPGEDTADDHFILTPEPETEFDTEPAPEPVIDVTPKPPPEKTEAKKVLTDKDEEYY